VEDVHGERILGYCHCGAHRKSPSALIPRTTSQAFTDVLEAVFWVETKGKTLEEIDAIFEGHKHSDVPDVEAVRQGREKIDVGVVELELSTVVHTAKAE
jgi:2',3'-cyclic-nucleotide 2'-phosphodiesterase (5'-nucleotidase family)